MDVSSIASNQQQVRLPTVADVAAIVAARSASQHLAQQAAVAAIAASDAAALVAAKQIVNATAVDLYM